MRFLLGGFYVVELQLTKFFPSEIPPARQLAICIHIAAV